MTALLLAAMLYGQRPMPPRNYGYQPPVPQRLRQPPGVLPMLPNQPNRVGRGRCSMVYFQGRWQSICW